MSKPKRRCRRRFLVGARDLPEPSNGEEATGKEAIAEQFKAIFDELAKCTLKVEVLSVEFVSPGVAVEQGIATVIPKDGEPEISEYSAVQLKHGDRSLLNRVTEKAESEPPSHYE